MVPEKLQLRNFMCYGDDVPPLQFDGLHVACISGNNGAGKSALLDALTWALWGKARAKSDDDLIKLDRDEMEVSLEFVIDAQIYRVIRRRKRGKRSGITTLDFQICDAGHTWRRLTGDTVTETQAAIDRVLRIEYDTFINSAFLLQGRADEFTGRKPAERKQVLADILGLVEYEEFEARAKSKRDELAKQIDIVRANIERLQTSVVLRDELEHKLAEAREQAATAEEDLADHEARVHELREQAAQFRAVAARHTSLVQSVEQQEQAQRELDTRIAELRVTVQALEDVIGRRDEIEQGFAALQAAHVALAKMDARREEAYRLNDEYKRLRGVLEGKRHQLEAEQRIAADRLNQLETQLARRGSAQTEREAFSEQLEAMESVQSRLAHLRDREAHLNEQHAALLTLQVRAKELQGEINVQRDSLLAEQQAQQRQIEQFEAQSTQLPELERALREARSEIIRLQALDDELATRREEVDTLVQQTATLHAEYNAIEATGKELNEKLRLLEQGEGRCPVCESELGADGIAHISAEYNERRAALREHIASIRRELRAAEAATEQQRTAIAQLEAQLAERARVEGRYARLELQQTQAVEAQHHAAEARATWNVLDHQLQSRAYAQVEQQQLAEIQAQLAALGDVRAIKDAIAQARAEIAETERRLEQFRAMQQQVARLDAELAALNQAEAQYPSVLAHYEAITAQLTGEAYGAEERQAIEAVLAEGQALGYRKEDHAALRDQLEALKQWDRAMLELERAQAALDPSREQLRLSEERSARYTSDLQAQRQEIAVLEQQLVGQPQIEQALRMAEINGQQLRAKQLTAHRVLASAEQSLRDCERDAQQLGEQQARATELGNERALYDELVQAFGKKGIQAMLIETAIPELEAEANELLGRMTENQFHLAFETQREKKTGDGPIETLDIRISDGLGTRDYQMYSGGEAFRVNFAIRIALSKLLARRAGASLKTLVIDEGFGSQDGKGRDRIVEAINTIQPEFERILVITHIDELKEQFQSRVEITKTADGSTWAVL